MALHITASDLIKKNYVKLDQGIELSSALGSLKRKKARTALVFNNGTYLGVLQREYLYKSKLSGKTKLKHFVKKVPELRETDDIVEIARHLLDANVAMLPVFKGGKLSGVVTAKAVADRAKKIKELKDLKVKDLMTSSVMLFEEDSRLGDVINFMKEHHVGHVPIIDGSGKLTSMLSFSALMETSLLRPVSKQQGSKSYRNSDAGYNPTSSFLMDVKAGDAAARPAYTIRTEDTLVKAISDLDKYNLTAITVKKAGKVVGILTVHDVLESFLRLRTFMPAKVHLIGTEYLKPLQFVRVKTMLSELYNKFIDKGREKEIQYLSIHIKTHNTTGKRQKYSVLLKLATSSQLYVAEDSRWHLETAINNAIEILDKSVGRSQSKERDKTRKSKTSQRVNPKELGRLWKRR